ncbi:MAG TPA: hypothetical protein VGQ53_24950 [Chitinophagaceae bacterium]|jgi:hypothetical protein|nr:hypothetical protein [Chitinophagaceae bacterium]
MRVILVIFAMLSYSYCFSQNLFRKNTLYAEFCGNGIDWSANFERQLGRKPGLGVRAGVGYASSTEEFRVSIPVGVNYLFDLSHQRSFIETGIGITWAEESIWKTGFQYPSSRYEAGFFASVGYRHQAPYGLMWRIDYTPFFTKYRVGYLFLGLSAGWSF